MITTSSITYITATMYFVINVLSRLAFHSKTAEPAITPPAIDTTPKVAPDDEPIHDTVAAIFAPIFESLERIEKMIDQMPDKPGIVKQEQRATGSSGCNRGHS